VTNREGGNPMKIASKSAKFKNQGNNMQIDKASGAVRMKIYMARTHQDFLTNLQMADKFQVSGHGALAGHTAKRG